VVELDARLRQPLARTLEVGDRGVEQGPGLAQRDAERLALLGCVGLSDRVV
jgi:hypothetical protein